MSGRLPGHRGLLRHPLTVAAEDPRGHELSELVPDHVLGDIDRQELVTVVDGQRVADELRRDRATARPGLEHPFLAAPVQGLDLPDQGVDDVRPLLDRTRHRACLAPLFLPAADDELVALLRFPGLESLAALAPRRA